jgi:hypothetical protein
VHLELRSVPDPDYLVVLELHVHLLVMVLYYPETQEVLEVL